MNWKNLFIGMFLVIFGHLLFKAIAEGSVVGILLCSLVIVADLLELTLKKDK